MTRDVARRLAFLAFRASSASAVLVLASSLIPACYPDGGGGTDPPTNTFYFPTGLAVSSGGNALYAVNSDFDLQWNGGTLQSYDLFEIRRDATRLIQANLSGGNVNALGLNLVQPWIPGQCITGNPEEDGGGAFQTITNNAAGRIPLGEGCSPPVNSTNYQRASMVIGAFATELQVATANGVVGTRLYTPVGGDATLTWADVGADDVMQLQVPMADLADASPKATALATDPFTLDCAPPGQNRCDDLHKAGNNANAPGDTRNLTIPGEPYGMAQTPDGTAIALTQQTENQTSLLEAADPDAVPANSPSMQFVLDDVVSGGSGITAIPHDPDSSVPPCPPVPNPQNCVNPAFLETSSNVAEIDLLRYYSDDNSGLKRPFLTKESAFPFTTNFGGTDSLGIVVDPTPRLACKHSLAPGADKTACADLPARLFFASRSPASLVVGEVGGQLPNNGGYSPDLVTPIGNAPLPPGPYRVYLAPIVNKSHNLELRVFVVNNQASSGGGAGTISVYDPNQDVGQPDLALIDTIYVGIGPSAMAFDPFTLEDVAIHANDPLDQRQKPELGLRNYRYGYVSSFTDSYVQVIDLDESSPTFESVVFTLGNPTPPKGT